MAIIGHNNASLTDVLEDVERLVEQRSEINADIKERLAKAEADGFDVRAIREMIKLRKMDREARIEFEDAREAYKDGLDLV